MALFFFNTSQNLSSHPHVLRVLRWWRSWFIPNRKIVTISAGQMSASCSLAAQIWSPASFLSNLWTKNVFYITEWLGKKGKENYFMTHEKSNFSVCKILFLEHSRARLLTLCLWLMSWGSGRAEQWQQRQLATKSPVFTLLPLQRNFANSQPSKSPFPHKTPSAWLILGLLHNYKRNSPPPANTIPPLTATVSFSRMSLVQLATFSLCCQSILPWWIIPTDI